MYLIEAPPEVRTELKAALAGCENAERRKGSG